MYQDLQWRFMAQTVMAGTTVSVALEAIDSSVRRLQPLGRADIRPAFAALAEGTWWVAAIDEQIVEGLGGRKSPFAQEYKAARDHSVYGKHIRGFLWARDRHTHQLPFSMDHDDTSFFGDPNSVIHINAGLVWRASNEMIESVDSRHQRERWRDVYDELLAGHSAWGTLEACSSWFHWLAGHSDSATGA